LAKPIPKSVPVGDGSDDELASLNAANMRQGVHRNRCRDGQLQGTADSFRLFENAEKVRQRLTLMILATQVDSRGIDP